MTAHRTRLLALLLTFTVLGAACSDTSDNSTTTTTGFDPEAATDGTAETFGALVEEAPDGDSFYVPPDPLPGENGDVIWARHHQSVEGGELYLVLYRSETQTGEPTAVSGWIAVPDGEAPVEGRPVITWGHGTRGIADTCAPTISDDPPSDDMPILADLLERGVVVAGSDYQGMGTPGHHGYAMGVSEAHSLLDAARAAQRFAPAESGEEVLIVGHSVGGHAMGFAVEGATDYAPELDIIGAVGSGAGVVTGTDAVVDYMITSDLKGYMMIAMASQAAEYGEDVAPYDRLLTDKGVEELAYLDDHCVQEILPYYAEIPSQDLFRLDDWDMTLTNGQHPGDLNAVGKTAPIAPILLVHGTQDTSVPGNFIVPWAEFACESQAVQLNWYEGPHRVFYDRATGAADDVLAWIDGRLAGEEPPSVCGAIPPMPAA